MRRKVLEKLRLIFWREMGDAISLGIAGMLLGLAVAPALGQEQTKPVIKIVATGGTIANTLDGRIPIQQVIADIRKNFTETHELLDSVHFEVIDLIRVGRARRSALPRASRTRWRSSKPCRTWCPGPPSAPAWRAT